MIVAVTVPWRKKGHDEKTQQQAKDAYFERMSMRGVERVFSVPRNTLAQWLEEDAGALPELAATLAEPQPEDVLELDELWSLVLRKANKRLVWLAYGGETNHIERWNNTLRQRLARFVRRTLSFSKSDRFHELVLKIFIHRYNLRRLQCISQV